MNRLARFGILVLALGACNDTQSLGSNNMNPRQACAGKRCGEPCSACAQGSCTRADVVGWCGADGICAAAAPVCSPGTGGGGPATGGAPGAGGNTAQGGAGGGDPGVGGVGGMGTGGGGPGVGGTGGTGGAGGAGGADAGTGGPAQCEYEGKLYAIGETRSLGDCNYCICQTWYGNAQFACTGRICDSGGAGAGGKGGAGGVTGTGGLPGTGGVGGSTGSGGSTGTCGDATVKAKYASCMATKDAQSCAGLGGTWRSPGGSAGQCVCPTGQDGCLCTKSSDCLAVCGAPASQPVTSTTCNGVTNFACTSTGGGAGCWCRPEETSAFCPL
jgi:hypothetical protein